MKLSLRSVVPAALLLAALAGWSFFTLLQKASGALQASLADSREMRVSETIACVTDSSSDAQFTGCSSIL